MSEQSLQVMVFFSSCAAVKYHAELLNYIDIPVKDIHGKQKQQRRTTTFHDFCKAETVRHAGPPGHPLRASPHLPMAAALTPQQCGVSSKAVDADHCSATLKARWEPRPACPGSAEEPN